MAQYCYISGTKTNCTDRCENCAKEMHLELKGTFGKADCVSEESIRHHFGDRAFQILKEFGYIEYCATLGGKRMYAI